jgi:hypothetical protein
MSGRPFLVSQPPIVQFQPVTGNCWLSPAFLPMIPLMPTKWLLCLLLAALATTRAAAQNSDLALLAGITGPHGRVVAGPNPIASGSVGAGGQINYAWQVLQRSVDLYVELPLVFTGESSGTATLGATISSNGTDIFFTPGLRLKISPQSRVSFYAVLGGGIGSLGSTQVTTGVTPSAVSNRVTTPALDFGGGLDFRLTRLLSLRGDIRDFVSRSVPPLSGRNRWMALVGIAFHF